MIRKVLIVFFVFLLLVGLVLWFFVGVRFGQLNCDMFKYGGKSVSCGPVVEFEKIGIKMYVTKIDSINFIDKGFEIDYFYGFDNEKWWSKYVYLKGRAIFSEEKYHLIRIILVNKPVVENVPGTIIYEESLTASEFKNLLDTKLNYELTNVEAVFSLMPPFKTEIFFNNRINYLTQIILKQ